MNKKKFKKQGCDWLKLVAELRKILAQVASLARCWSISISKKMNVRLME